MKQIMQSLLLDYRFLWLSYLKFDFKIIFLIKKYYLLIKHIILKMPYKTGSYVLVWKKSIYYNGIYGLADYQSILVRHYNILSKYIWSIDVAFDVWCNMGLFTRFLNQAFSPRIIYSFDPLNNVISLAKKNNINEHNVVYINKWISNFTWETIIELDPDDTYRASLSSWVNTNNTNNTHTIDVVTLDHICLEYDINAIDLLKIDVEWWEYEALQWAREALKKTKVILVEIEVINPRWITFPQILSLLTWDLEFDMVSMIHFNQIWEWDIVQWDFVFVNKSLF